MSWIEALSIQAELFLFIRFSTRHRIEANHFAVSFKAVVFNKATCFVLIYLCRLFHLTVAFDSESILGIFVVSLDSYYPDLVQAEALSASWEFSARDFTALPQTCNERSLVNCFRLTSISDQVRIFQFRKIQIFLNFLGCNKTRRRTADAYALVSWLLFVSF